MDATPSVKCSDCGKVFEIGDWPYSCKGKGHQAGPFFTGNAQIHAQDKVVVLENRFTGDIKIPGRGDRPVHPKLAAEGYVRKELDTHADIRRVEQKTGTRHEAGNYGSNSSQELKDTGSVGR